MNALKNPIDNTIDFVKIETDSIVKAINEQDLDAVLRLLPVYVRDIQKLINELKGE
jgi:hypothetical protein